MDATPHPGSQHKPLACVMGDIDMVRPLGLAGIRCVVLGQPREPAHYSRFTRKDLSWKDEFWDDPSGPTDEWADKLMRFGSAQPDPPVLFYVSDAHLLFISRHREKLGRAFRFVIADAALIEDLVDKSRFQDRAERLHLPVPPTRSLRLGEAVPADLGLRFPIVIKPSVRREPWPAIGGAGKVLRVETPRDLRERWPQLMAVGMDLLAQEMIPGPETRIESYHVYVDEIGTIAGEFTGRKIRTFPECYGLSTALETSDAADVRDQGRMIVRQLNLRGVAKFDFKRGPDDKLYLLEVNPRFTLWHHLGAVAGLNLPALVYSDLVGLPRAPVSQARAGVRWCRIGADLRAARERGIPLLIWLPWALRCQAKPLLSWDDPMPFVWGAWQRWCARRAGTKESSEST